ncbi:MAG: BMC domain-containing protein [Clostridiales bacterium]|nr:BMC domain-containing protein [Clostridiales bacterium]
MTAADAAAKSANIRLLGYEYAKGGGMCTVKVEGEVAACRAAIAAAEKAVERMNSTTGGTKSTLIIGRPADSTSDTMVYNRETVGGDIALAEGYRPKGESRMPVLVKDWKPKAEPKAEIPIEEAPEPPVVEELEEGLSTEEEAKSEDIKPEEDIVQESETVTAEDPQTGEPESTDASETDPEE